MFVGHSKVHKPTNNGDGRLPGTSSGSDSLIKGAPAGKNLGHPPLKSSMQVVLSPDSVPEKPVSPPINDVLEPARTSKSADLDEVHRTSHKFDTSTRASLRRSKNYKKHFSQLQSSIQQVIDEEYGVAIRGMGKAARDCLLSAMLEKLDGCRSSAERINTMDDCKKDITLQLETKPARQKHTYAPQKRVSLDQVSITGNKRLDRISCKASSDLDCKKAHIGHTDSSPCLLRELDHVFTTCAVPYEEFITPSAHASHNKEQFMDLSQGRGDKRDYVPENKVYKAKNRTANHTDFEDQQERVVKPMYESREPLDQSLKKRKTSTFCKKNRRSGTVLIGYREHEPSATFAQSGPAKYSVFEEVNPQLQRLPRFFKSANCLSQHVTDFASDEEEYHGYSKKGSKLLRSLNDDHSGHILQRHSCPGKEYKKAYFDLSGLSNTSNDGCLVEQHLQKWPICKPEASFDEEILQPGGADDLVSVCEDFLSTSSESSLPWIESENPDTHLLHHMAVPDDIQSYTSDSRMKAESVSCATSEVDLISEMSQSQSDLMAISVPSFSQKTTAFITGFGSPIVSGGMCLMNGIEAHPLHMSSQDVMSISDLEQVIEKSKNTTDSGGSQDCMQSIDLSEEFPDIEMHENFLSPIV